MTRKLDDSKDVEPLSSAPLRLSICPPADGKGIVSHPRRRPGAPPWPCHRSPPRPRPWPPPTTASTPAATPTTVNHAQRLVFTSVGISKSRRRHTSKLSALSSHPKPRRRLPLCSTPLSPPTVLQSLAQMPHIILQPKYSIAILQPNYNYCRTG